MMSNINNTIEYINGLAESDPKELIARSENRFANIINDIADKVQNDAGREIIMLAGPSASGKTTTANKLAGEFTKRGMKTYRISLDDFYLNRADLPCGDNGMPDFETVLALDLPCISKTLNSLLDGKTTKVPIFDFVTGTRSEKYDEITLGESDAIVVEGLHALNPVITDNLPSDKLLKIYISVSSRIYNESGKIILNKRNMRFIRRLVRDYNFRGSSVENTYNLWENVRIGEDKYLFPYKDNADIRINSVHLSEPCLFKNIVLEMLENADLSSKYASDCAKLIRALNQFENVPTSFVPENSLLREFLG